MNVWPNFSNALVFPDNMEIPKVLIPLDFSDVPLFSKIMSFRASSVPPKLSYVPFFLDNMDVENFPCTPGFLGCPTFFEDHVFPGLLGTPETLICLIFPG